MQIEKHKKTKMMKKKNLFVDVAQEVDFISQRSHLILQICLHQVGRVYVLNTHPRKQTPLHSLNKAREFIITADALLGEQLSVNLDKFYIIFENKSPNT